MGGFVAFVGHTPAAPRILDGLRLLEADGGEPAGVALLQGTRLLVYKLAEGVEPLEERIPEDLTAPCGIGHVAWTDQGPRGPGQAQPQVDPTGTVAVAHHGRVRNARHLRRWLIAEGAEPCGETDAELLALLVLRCYAGCPVEAVRTALEQVEGAIALAAVFAGHPRRVVAAHHGAPVAIGIGDGWTHLATDPRRLPMGVHRIVRLDEGDTASVGANVLEVRPRSARGERRTVQRLTHGLEGRAGAPAQPRTLSQQLVAQPATLHRALDEPLCLADLDLGRLAGVTVLAEGTSRRVAPVGAQMLESLTGLACRAEPSSTFHRRGAVLEPNRLYVGLSHSGESLDTLAALQHVRRSGGRSASIVHAAGSSIAASCRAGLRLVGAVHPLAAATEQVVALAQLGLGIAQARHRDVGLLEQALSTQPDLVARVLEATGPRGPIGTLADQAAERRYALFLGDGAAAAVAAFGAWALRDLAAIPTNHVAGDLRRDPAALVDPGTPVVALLLDPAAREAATPLLGAVRERGGLVAIVHRSDDLRAARLGDLSIPLPRTAPVFAPLLAAVPLQVLAYRTARAAGRVDALTSLSA